MSWVEYFWTAGLPLLLMLLMLWYILRNTKYEDLADGWLYWVCGICGLIPGASWIVFGTVFVVYIFCTYDNYGRYLKNTRINRHLFKSLIEDKYD